MAKGTHDTAPDPRNASILISVNGELKARDEAMVSVFDSGFVLGDGVSCVMGTLTNFGTQFAGQSGNPKNTASAFAPIVAPGNTRYYNAR